MTTDHENALDRLMSTLGPEVVAFWREGSPRNRVTGTLVGTTNCCLRFGGEAREGECCSSSVQPAGARRRRRMRIIDERCCGLDVHNKSIMACWLTPDERGGTRQQVRRFGAITRDLLELAD